MPFYQIEGRGEESGRKWKPRQYFAANESSALRQAKKDGLKVDSVTLMSVFGCLTTVAGCSHKNSDNSDRQKILKKCSPYDSLILEHEIGNKHDKHAIKIMRVNGEQLGYVPQEIAQCIIDGYWKESGCNYCAINLGIESMGDDTDFLTTRIVILVAFSTLSAEKLNHGTEQELSRHGIILPSQEIIAWQKLKGIERAVQQRSKPAGRMNNNSGCLGVVVFAAFAVILPLIFMLN
jgi:HIRAN domain